MPAFEDASFLLTGPDPAPYLVQDQPVFYTRDYTCDPVLNRQYQRGAGLQWQVGDPALFDWTTSVDYTKPVQPDEISAFYGTKYWDEMIRNGGIELLRQRQLTEAVSQFMHGEQGGIRATSLIVIALEGCDAAQVAAMQVADEARHTEFYRRALARAGHAYPANPAFQQLLDEGMQTGKLHLKFISVQILIEGAALASFNSMRKALVLARDRFGGGDELLRTGIEYVIKDEARHVTFGIEMLERLLPGLTPAEHAEACGFVYEGFDLLQQRLLPKHVCMDYGIDPDEVFPRDALRGSPRLRNALTNGVLPKALRLGLVPDGWRQRYTDDYGVDWDLVGKKAAAL
jgi:hypothetical protein